ncbi:acyltransferase family protein [Asanoa sp. NPDC050611]|uniref:acyltransferase family protein n=1 Tax=Asanoa sp. NPDC050611 TaxID=3157098 RepID=UPI0033DE7C9B
MTTTLPIPRLAARTGGSALWRSSWADAAPPARLEWADAAKGACILLVVSWHVIVKDYLLISWHIGLPLPGVWGTLGEQFLPLRMPLFFTISGLFAANAVLRPWRVVLKSRVAMFLYLYAVWLLIHTAILPVAPDLPTERASSVPEFLTQLTITPSNLWYLYALAIYFVVAKAVRRVPRWAVLVPAAALSAVAAAGLVPTPGDRGSFYQNLVFFLGGLYFRPQVERLAARRRRLAPFAAAFAAALVLMALLGAQSWFGVWLLVSVVAVVFGVVASARLARWPALHDRLVRLGRITLPIYVIHMPVLAVLHRLLVGPLSALGGAWQVFVAVFYPPLLTGVVVASSLGIHRGLMAVGARRLFSLPRFSRPTGATP